MLTKIKMQYDTLTPTGKRIANVILAEPNRITQMSIQEFASESGVAPSAVIRFCRTLNVEGFPEFKRRLIELLSVRTTREALPAIQKGATASDVFQSVFRSGMHALEDTLRLLNSKTITEICNHFRKAKRIFFFGVGTSSIVATDAHYRFLQLGFPAQSCSDIVFMNVAALNMKEGDVAVGISHSGQTKATLDTMRRASEAGAITIAITSFSDSLLAQLCDYSVVAFADEENYPVEAVSARLAHICIIDALMMTLAAMDFDSLPERLGGRNAILKDIRYQ